MAYQVESAITASDGRGVLWVLDSWDALPSHLRERSLLRDMIITPNRSSFECFHHSLSLPE